MRTTAKTRPKTALSYAERVNLAIDYVLLHLDEPLRLKDVSRAARLSPFHFHRVFQVLMNETLADFIKRRRLEKALSIMTYRAGASLTSIALECGFASSSDFSRCFRQRFGSPPSKFDLSGWQEAQRSELEALVSGATERFHLHRVPEQPNPDRFQVKLRKLPRRTVAYIRVLNPYRGTGVLTAVRRLLSWAERRGLADRQWLGYQWENPELTPLDHCQYHVAVETDEFTAKGDIGRFEFPPMVVAQIEIRGGIELELRAVQWLYGSWLPASRYVPDNHPCFEAWIGKPFAHGTGHFELHVQLPVKPA